MRFSQRIGKTPIQSVVQVDSMEVSLKNRLFNLIEELITTNYEDPYRQIENDFLRPYCDYFGLIYTDQPHSSSQFIKILKLNCYQPDGHWYIYDMIEWLSQTIPYNRETNIDAFNRILESEKSGYRLTDSGSLIPLVSDIELDEINLGDELSDKYKAVNEHLQKARDAYSSRSNPDYENSIKESVSAIEAISRIIANDKNATLEETIKKIPSLNINLAESLKKLYHFRGDQGGVGHAIKVGQKSTVDENDARLILVLAHTLVNYLISKFLNHEQ